MTVAAVMTPVPVGVRHPSDRIVITGAGRGHDGSLSSFLVLLPVSRVEDSPGSRDDAVLEQPHERRLRQRALPLLRLIEVKPRGRHGGTATATLTVPSLIR